MARNKDHSATILDVSSFSVYGYEGKRLFLGKTLIIVDILCVNEETKKWRSLKKWVSALHLFEKLTTGKAADVVCSNTNEGLPVMRTVADIIEDHSTSLQNTTPPNDIPEHIQALFRTYLRKQKTPRFDNITNLQYWDQVPQRFLNALFVFDESDKPILSAEKVKIMFPKTNIFFNADGNEVRDGNVLSAD